MLDPNNVTACLVTRGNVPMDPILETLPFAKVLIWDNSTREYDLKVYGRYEMAQHAETEWIAWVDDDVVFTEWDALLEASECDTFVSNNAHGPNHGGYNDLALQAAGAIIPKSMIQSTWDRWWRRYPVSTLLPQHQNTMRATLPSAIRGQVTFRDGVLYEADFIFGVLCERWKQVDLPYTRLYADDDSRLCRQPWQETLKLHMTNLAREIRDQHLLFPQAAA